MRWITSAEKGAAFNWPEIREWFTADSRVAGYPIGQFNCQIAAIAPGQGANIVTRNVSDYEVSGIVALNPWTVGVSMEQEG